MYTIPKLKSSGFTLIELLVAITIIGILATIGLRAFTGAQAKSRDAKRKTDLAAIQRALEVYYNDFGQYPQSDSGLIQGCGSGDPATQTSCSWGSRFAVGNDVYMEKLPQDSSGSYYYFAPTAGNGGQSYFLFARLENLDDKDIPRSGSTIYSYITWPSGQVPTVCRSSSPTRCNYMVTSTNAQEAGNIVKAGES